MQLRKRRSRLTSTQRNSLKQKTQKGAAGTVWRCFPQIHRRSVADQKYFCWDKQKIKRLSSSQFLE
jgi:hypothetical protein